MVDFGFALTIVSIIYLVLVLLILWRSRPLAHKLIALGLLTAVFSAWATPLLASVQVHPGQAGVIVGSDAPGLLGRIAVVLVLGGVGVSIMGLWNNPLETSYREETYRANP